MVHIPKVVSNHYTNHVSRWFVIQGAPNIEVFALFSNPPNHTFPDCVQERAISAVKHNTRASRVLVMGSQQALITNYIEGGT